MRRRLVVGSLAAAFLIAAPMAGADQATWRDGYIGPDAKDASGSVTGLRASSGYAESSSRIVEVAAHYPGSWTMYGNWISGFAYACHAYSGADTLGALIHNPHTVSQNPMTGVMRWPSWEWPCQ